MVASPATPRPIASILSSAGPSRTNELANFDSSYTTVVCSVPPIPPQGSGVHRGPIPDNVHSDLLKRTPVSFVQMMAQTYPITYRLASNAQASTSRNYEADVTRLKEDLTNMLNAKLGVDMSRSCLYQKPYPDDFDLVSYPIGWRVSDFIKFSGNDNRTT